MPPGRFSAQLDGGLKPGDKVRAKGPYGTCFRREGRPGPMLLIGGGSAYRPCSRSSATTSQRRAGVRSASSTARAPRAICSCSTNSRPSLKSSRTSCSFRRCRKPTPADAWSGETGFIHQVVQKRLKDRGWMERSTPTLAARRRLIDAVLPILRMANLEPERIFFDKFTPATPIVTPGRSTS